MHESAAHKKLRTLLPPEPVVEFYGLGEFTADFYLEESKVVIMLIDDTHDHTDSYHIEKSFDDEARRYGLKAVFIEERMLFEDPEKTVKMITGA